MSIRRSVFCAAAAAVCLCTVCYAQGTKLWTVTRYDEMERGTTNGVAIRSDGTLEPGLATTSLFQSGGNLAWSVAAGPGGSAYLGLGGTSAGAAVVMRIGPDGKAAKVLEARELGVQALRAGVNGAVYAATSPEGKIYKLGATPAEATVVFDAMQTEEKPKYIWDIAQASNGDLYVATGAPAVVYRVRGTGAPQIAFRTADQHIRCLLLSADGTLWAGTDGAGVIYRFDTKATGAKPFAAYSAARREITSLAVDSAGNVYAAGVGQRNGPSLPPLAVNGNVNVPLTGLANAANGNTLVPEGSEIYKIAPDGTPSKLLTLHDDVVYALAMHGVSLLAATGNRGRIYRVDTGAAGRFTDLAHLESAQGMALAEAGSSVLVATSNSGRLYRLDDKPAADATYTSEVFDSRVFSRWGRVEVQSEGSGAADLFVRTGNVENPVMGWSDWVPAHGTATVPSGRYAQWKAVLRPGAQVGSVALNYVEKNLAPVVDDVVVQPGARAQPTLPSANTTVPINFNPPANPSGGMNFDANPPALIAQKDRNAVTVRWNAHDDNGDDMMFAVYYRGTGEKNWKLLGDKISDRFLSFESSRLPDGSYEVRVVASDAPDHTDADTLTGDRVSSPFLLDTTPPIPGPLTAAVVAGSPSKVHVTFSAKDATSPITRAEYSVDAGPWQYLEPVSKVSDSLEERYEFSVDLPTAVSGATDPREHVVAVRVFDRFDNVVSAKTVVH